MDSIFKQKLLGLRTPKVPKTFREALFGPVDWCEGLQKTQIEAPQKEVFSEKVQVIESLERFAQEKVSELGSPLLKIEGGEILIKDAPDWSQVRSFQSLSELRNVLRLDTAFVDVVMANKRRGEVQVLFVSEKFRAWDDVKVELKTGFINELIAAFPLKTAELFERMISAMKLLPEEVIIFPVEGNDGKDFSEDVMTVAASFMPQVVITLGATATSRILKSNDRLSQVHGQFFSRKVSEGQSLQIVPLFHPSIIETNQNMKKTAWADMQKIMKHLKKLP